MPATEQGFYFITGDIRLIHATWGGLDLIRGMIGWGRILPEGTPSTIGSQDLMNGER